VGHAVRVEVVDALTAALAIEHDVSAVSAERLAHGLGGVGPPARQRREPPGVRADRDCGEVTPASVTQSSKIPWTSSFAGAGLAVAMPPSAQRRSRSDAVRGVRVEHHPVEVDPHWCVKRGTTWIA
jgi:hypothetical protein